jgi:hypothetical protein
VHRTARTRHRRLASILSGAICGMAVLGLVSTDAVVLAAPAQAADANSSEVTISAKDYDPDYRTAPFPDLSVTVSQTKNLVQQGVTVSWTGAVKPTGQGSSNGWYLQVFQCWGDDPANSSRPDRTTCQYGASGPSTQAVDAAKRDSGRRLSTIIPAEDQAYTATDDPNLLYTSIPFRARNGVVVSSVVDGPQGTKIRDTAVDVNDNPFFNTNSTNMVGQVRPAQDGTGSVPFEIQTTMQSPGLGCGDPVETAGLVRGQSCWLVILPRAAADNGSSQINTSGLFWQSWQHAIAVRTEFAPVGARCPIGAAERQLAGSEVASLAVQSWQPTLCRRADGAVYSHLTLAESDALAAAGTAENAPLALTTYPETEDSGSLVYAPIALSGIAISFAIDRNPNSFGNVPEQYAKAAMSPFKDLNLTPRLLAKLLTNSYWHSVPDDADRSYLDPDNVENLTFDPDFLAVNDPEWGYQRLYLASLSDALVPQGRSDAARAVWSYILTDPDAAAFMAGEPDPWGMTVNPWYDTVAEKNASGTAFAPLDSFPKADPVEVPATSTRGAINVITWRPYVNDLNDAAYLTLRGDGKRISDWDPNSVPPKYKSAGRDPIGQRGMLALTDSAAVARYQVQVASLRNSAGQFVKPTTAALEASAAVMEPKTDDGVVRGLNFTSEAAKSAEAAYPLAVPVYAAADPSLLSSELRTDYADFIRYAATDGQVSGVSLGELPSGYAPIPQTWVDQALNSAQTIETGSVPSAPTTASPATTSTGTPSSYVPISPGAVSPNAAAAAPAAAAPSGPSATGATAPALAGATTPDDPSTGAIVAAVPAAVLGAAACALAIPVVGRLRRRL